MFSNEHQVNMESSMNETIINQVIIPPTVEIVVIENEEPVKSSLLEKVEEVLVVQIKKEELSEEDKLKIAYMEELEQANIQIAPLQQNLKEMCDMGYFNYKVNYNLLVRNNNDLQTAVEKLCNQSIADSVFT